MSGPAPPPPPRGPLGATGWSSRFALGLAILVAAGVAGAGAPDDLLHSGHKLYSQHDEELIIRHFFDDRRGGFFVDVGSFHWQNLSTTYYLEHHLGWSGIAVDALPGLAAGYQKHRPRTRFFQYIVTDRSGTLETLYAAGSLSSTSEEHIERFPTLAGQVKPKPIQVPTITLDELLERNGVARVDFLSLDIEEGEPAALAGFDIDRYRPELVCVSAGPPVRDRLAAYFAAHGYERIDAYLEFDAGNWYYRPQPRRPWLGAAAGLSGAALVWAVWWGVRRRHPA